MESNWEALANPYGRATKQLFFQLLKERYSKHEDIIDRISDEIKRTKDYEAIGKLLVDVYEVGFKRAIDQQRAALTKAGFAVNIVAEQPIPKSPGDTQK